MRTRPQRLAAVMLSAMLMVGMFAGAAGASTPVSDHQTASDIEQQWEENPTVGTYQDWLAAETTDDPQAAEVLAEFNRLTAEEQERFVALISDPDTLETALNVDVEPGQSEELADGAITVEVAEGEQIVDSSDDATGQATHRGFFTRDLVVFGVTLVRNEVWVDYAHNGSVATSINSSGSGYNNFVPLTHKTYTNHSPYTADGFAHTSTTWNYSLVYEGIGFTVSAEQSVRSNPTTGGFGEWRPI